MLSTVLAASLLLGPSFEEAKKDPSKRAAYVAEALKAAGVDGLIKAWYFQTDAKHEAALKEEYKADGREFFFAKEIKNILAPLDVATLRSVIFVRDGVYAGSGSKAGVLVVGDLFALSSEDEVKSVFEDYLKTFASQFENGMKIKDREIDTAVPAVKNITTTILLKLVGQAQQLEAILKGKRKVSDGFKQEAIKQYLATYRIFSLEVAKQKKIYDDNNENTLQKEIYDSLEFLRAELIAQIKGGGLEHKVLNKDTHENTLEPVKN